MSPETAILESRIRQEMLQLERLVDELWDIMRRHREAAAKDTVVLRALGSILHDFYSGVEKIFLHIAREIDQNVPKGEGWHRLLLQQMTLHVKGRRPPVISTELARDLDPFLSFLHRFRNLYGFELEWERMEPLLASVPEVAEGLRRAIESFLDLLAQADTDG